MHKKGIIMVLAVCLLIAVADAQLSHKEGHCPLRNSVSKCTPKCVSDFQCSFNEKCCPNKCGSESCVSASPVSTGNGYKGSSNDDVYCGGVKCGPYQKCKFDRRTKREKCVRT
ncbi:waprin-Thr1-like [Bombus vosnesenskii]|uniref:Waprin-Thr1-like n=2 Tax=Pyrobombus TaxID=144703 RepID=A0A6J3K4A1_9HYME|nr:waprin-Thr1 [Bombus impatiens]XP_033347331.1 waprin-Thr1-like [Bombus vosnesenskii]XP_050486116.1 waprin-Thr1-like [Bombus huntii]